MTSSFSSLPLAHDHHLTIKLTSGNYLLWRNQVSSLLASHDVLSYIDGSKPIPAETITSRGKSVPNPAYQAWHWTDQKVLSLLLSSLSAEAMTEARGCRTSRCLWTTMESTFSHSPPCRINHLHDELMALRKLRQLASIGRPIDGGDQLSDTHLAIHFEQFLPKCQICGERNHYADRCPQRYNRSNSQSSTVDFLEPYNGTYRFCYCCKWSFSSYFPYWLLPC